MKAAVPTLLIFLCIIASVISSRTFSVNLRGSDQCYEIKWSRVDAPECQDYYIFVGDSQSIAIQLYDVGPGADFVVRVEINEHSHWIQDCREEGITRSTEHPVTYQFFQQQGGNNNCILYNNFPKFWFHHTCLHFRNAGNNGVTYALNECSWFGCSNDLNDELHQEVRRRYITPVSNKTESKYIKREMTPVSNKTESKYIKREIEVFNPVGVEYRRDGIRRFVVSVTGYTEDAEWDSEYSGPNSANVLINSAIVTIRDGVEYLILFGGLFRVIVVTSNGSLLYSYYWTQSVSSVVQRALCGG